MLHKQNAGSIIKNPVLSKIVSIGYELESASISPCVINDNTITCIDNEIISPDGTIARSTDTTIFGVVTPFTAFENRLIRDGKIVIHENGGDQDDKNYTIVTNVSDPRSQAIYHTEFKITYLDPEMSDNILLNYCQKAIGSVIEYYKYADITPVYTPYLSNELFLCRMYNDCALAIGSSDDLDIPADIPWHIQCTIGIRLVDLVDIISYISQGNGYDISSVYKIQNNYLKSVQSPTPEETNICFLYAMYEHMMVKGLRKIGANSYVFAIRHDFNDIYEYHEDAISRLDIIVNNPLVFGSVTRYPYNGVILVELRDFYDQLIYTAFGERSEGYDFGKPLDDLMNAVLYTRDL